MDQYMYRVEERITMNETEINVKSNKTQSKVTNIYVCL